jgi:hypothetical protein
LVVTGSDGDGDSNYFGVASPVGEKQVELSSGEWVVDGFASRVHSERRSAQTGPRPHLRQVREVDTRG